jgi:hypothetical protein
MSLEPEMTLGEARDTMEPTRVGMFRVWAAAALDSARVATRFVSNIVNLKRCKRCKKTVCAGE